APVRPLPGGAAATGLVVVKDMIIALAGRRVWVLHTWDVDDGGWTEGARARSARTRPAVVTVTDVVHVIGGRTGRVLSDHHEVYNPFSDGWFLAARPPTARS